jgi:pyrroloquinoline quinone biosynthesis protein D
MSGIRRTARPRLGIHARLQWDPVRQKQMFLAPERVVVLNETAAAILALCDGQRSVATIAAELSTQYQRPVEEDVLALLARLAGKGLIEVDDHE